MVLTRKLFLTILLILFASVTHAQDEVAYTLPVEWQKVEFHGKHVKHPSSCVNVSRY